MNPSTDTLINVIVIVNVILFAMQWQRLFSALFLLQGISVYCKSGVRLKVGHKSLELVIDGFSNFFVIVFSISPQSISLSALNLVSFSLKRSRIIKYSLETCFPEKVLWMQPLKADKTWLISRIDQKVPLLDGILRKRSRNSLAGCPPLGQNEGSIRASVYLFILSASNSI